MISIIIPVYNNWMYTLSCLRDLSKLTVDNEVIVVDNASTDATKKEIGKYNVKYIRNNGNYGFGRANNIGYAASRGEYIMFLNNDIKVVDRYEDWVNLAMEPGVIAGPTYGKIGKVYDFIGEYNRSIGGGYIYMSGWCVTAQRAVWEKLNEGFMGPWNELYLAYWEDTHMGMLAKERKVDTKLIDLPVKHYGRKTGSKMNMGKIFLESKERFTKLWGDGRIDSLWTE